MIDSQAIPDSQAGVADQLRDIERQGGGMARFAHLCAGALLVAGSLGSLISISAQAFAAFLAAAQAGRLDLPDLLNAVVGVLLVLAGDAALLYAASMLRVLRSSQAPREEMRVHLWVMIGVSILEAGTYLYMAWLFDRPSNFVLWLIDIGRAIAWPLLCSYLSMARPLPVGPRDIMYHSALASGKGVVRDIATLSADPAAPLHHKVRIFRAASNMTQGDRAKLDTLVTELTTAPEATISISPAIASLASPTATLEAPQSPVSPDRPPTGPGSPQAATATRRRSASTQNRPGILKLTPPDRPARQAARASTNGSGVRTRVPVENYEPQARAAWAEGARSIPKMERATGMSHSAAQSWVRTLKAEAAAMASNAGQAAQ